MCPLASIPIELHSIGRKNLVISPQRLNQGSHKTWIKAHIVVYEQQKIAGRHRGAPVQSWRQPHILTQRKPSRLKLPRHLGGVIRRAIVYDDGL